MCAKSINELLSESAAGNKAALDEMWPLLYEELHRLATQFLRKERPDHTLQPTALLHEAYLRLVDQRTVDWHNRAQFLGVAARTMRRVLVNYAEARHAAKRGGRAEKVSIDASVEAAGEPAIDVLALDQVLKRLEEIDPPKGRMVELRYFGGLSIDEIAEAMKKSKATISRDLSFAKAWLFHELSSLPSAATD